MSPEMTQGEKTFDTFCPSCDTEVTATVVSRIESLPIRGEDTSYIAEVAVCPICGGDIGDSRIEENNLLRAYDAYRHNH